MAPKKIFRRHLPLITPRIGFTVQVLPPPPSITLRINLAEKIKHRPSRRDDATAAPKLVVAERPVRPADSRDSTPQAPASDAGVPESQKDYMSDLSELDSIDGQPGTSTAKLIPKPPGEPGRPHSGGFNLEDAVISSGWPKQDFAAFRKRTHDLITQTLDESKGFAKQSDYKLGRIYNKLKKDFPRLCRYEELWPAVCIIKAKLKSTLELARRQAKATSPPNRETPAEE